MIRHEQIQTLLAPPISMTMRLMGKDGQFQPDKRDQAILQFCIGTKRNVVEVAKKFKLEKDNARCVLQRLKQFGLMDCEWVRAFDPQYAKHINKLVYWTVPQ